MSSTRANERSILNTDLGELVQSTHHPEIYEQTTTELLQSQKRLRQQRARLRAIVRNRQRYRSADMTEIAFPADVLHPLKQKQILSSALKRVNRELARQRAAQARAATEDSARRALALYRRAKLHVRPFSDHTPKHGMRAVPSDSRRQVLLRSKVGRVSQATKAAQAKKDQRM